MRMMSTSYQASTSIFVQVCERGLFTSVDSIFYFLLPYRIFSRHTQMTPWYAGARFSLLARFSTCSTIWPPRCSFFYRSCPVIRCDHAIFFEGLIRSMTLQMCGNRNMPLERPIPGECH